MRKGREEQTRDAELGHLEEMQAHRMKMNASQERMCQKCIASPVWQLVAVRLRSAERPRARRRSTAIDMARIETHSEQTDERGTRYLSILSVKAGGRKQLTVSGKGHGRHAACVRRYVHQTRAAGKVPQSNLADGSAKTTRLNSGSVATQNGEPHHGQLALLRRGQQQAVCALFNQRHALSVPDKEALRGRRGKRTATTSLKQCTVL